MDENLSLIPFSRAYLVKSRDVKYDAIKNEILRSAELGDYLIFKKGNHLVCITQSKRDCFNPPGEVISGGQNVLML